jgi:hypothetical protein
MLARSSTRAALLVGAVLAVRLAVGAALPGGTYSQGKRQAAEREA